MYDTPQTRALTRPQEPQNAAVAAVLAERQFQDVKHGVIDGAGGHTLGEWLLLLEAELAEAKAALIKGGSGRDSVRSEIIQLTAVGLAALEQHGLVDPHDGRQV